MGNVTKAFFYSSKVCKTEPLFQYDYGQILQFVVPYTLPPTYEVHFSNQLHGTAKPQIGNADGVAIPDEYLETGETIYAWLFLHTGPNDGETELTAIIPVIGKSKTTNTPIKPVQQDVITETIAALNSGVERAEAAADGIEQTVDDALAAAKASGEFDGKDGTDGTNGIDGVTFTPSVSPSGVLSWTNDGGRQNPESVNIKGAPGQNGLDGMDGVDGKDGPPGKDGTDGVSPAVTIASITGGHSVTITDADHPNGQTFDVMDGANGADGVGVPSGGTQGQVLAKTSGTDFATEWVTPYTGTAVINVSSSTPSITAVADTQYICGEVSTLDITLPASGIVDVVFESGSTPTVLTITPPTGMTVEWANGFDSTALEADTLYELNIKMVGTKCLGVAGAWT